MEALARVESVAGAEGANRIAEFVGKVGTAGKLRVPEAEALKGTGVTIDALYTQIAERMGVGKDKVEALLKAGKVTAEEGIDALNAAIAAKLGKGAAAAMLRFDVQILKAKESLAGMLAGVDWSPLQKGLATVLSAFDDSTASGQKLKALTQDFFGTMGALAARAAPYVKAFLEGMIDGVSSMWEGMKAALPTIEKLLGISPDGTDTEKWRQFGETVAKLAFYAAGAAAGILAVVGAVVGFAAWIGSVIAGVGDAADGVGAKFSWLGSIAKVVLSPVVGAVGIVIDVFKALGSALDWVIGKFNALRGASSTSVQLPTVTGSTAAAGGAANDNGGGATSGGGAVGDAIASPRSGAAAPAAGGRSVVFNVSAPVTISVPPGGNAAQAGRDAADGFWLRVRELAEVAA